MPPLFSRRKSSTSSTSRGDKKNKSPSILSASPRRTPSPFRFRRKDKHQTNNEETDSDTTSSTKQNQGIDSQQKLTAEKKKKRSKTPIKLFRRKSKKGNGNGNGNGKEDIPKKPSHFTYDDIDIVDSKDNTPKDKKNKKKTSHLHTNLGSGSNVNHRKDSYNITPPKARLSLESTSSLFYPPSKLHSKEKPSKSKDSYLVSYGESGDDTVEELPHKIEFENDDDEQSVAKSVDTQQYAEYENVISQLKEKMMKDQEEKKTRIKQLENDALFQDGGGTDMFFHPPLIEESFEGNDGDSDNDDTDEVLFSNADFISEANTGSDRTSTHSLNYASNNSHKNTSKQSHNHTAQDFNQDSSVIPSLGNNAKESGVSTNNRPEGNTTCIINGDALTTRLPTPTKIQTGAEELVLRNQSQNQKFDKTKGQELDSNPITINNIDGRSSEVVFDKPVKAGQKAPPSTTKEAERIYHLNQTEHGNSGSSNTSSNNNNNTASQPLRGELIDETAQQGPQHHQDQSQQHPQRRQEQQYQNPDMSSRRKSRFSSSSSQPNKFQDSMGQDQQNPPERRRNFAFMRQEASPHRRRVSSATLERTRAHAKKLARIAAANIQGNDFLDDASNNSTGNDFGHQEANKNNGLPSDGFDAQFNTQGSSSTSFLNTTNNTNTNISMASTNKNKPSLNFAAFETDSCISSNTSVYDMDFIDQMPSFDDTASSVSFFSTASSTISNASSNRFGGSIGGAGMRKSKNKLDMYNGVSGMKGSRMNFQQYQHPSQQNHRKQSQSLDMFSPQVIGEELSSPSAFHPHSASNKNNHNNNQSQNHALNRSNISTTSNGSSISGAAARRLMRRGMSQQNIPLASTSQHQHQQQQQYSGGSVEGAVSAGSERTDGSQYSALETPEKDRFMHFQEQQQLQQQQQQVQQQKQKHSARSDDKRPPLSPVPFFQENLPKSNRDANKSSGKSSSTRKKKKKVVLEPPTGFTFDAFGLDPNEIDNEVNAAMKELGDANMDLSLFTSASSGSTVGEDSSNSSLSGSSVMATHQMNGTIDVGRKHPQSAFSSKFIDSAKQSLENRNFHSDDKKKDSSKLRERFQSIDLPDIPKDSVDEDDYDYALTSVLAVPDKVIDGPSNQERKYSDTVETRTMDLDQNQSLNSAFMADRSAIEASFDNAWENHGRGNSSWKPEFGQNDVHNEELEDVDSISGRVSDGQYGAHVTDVNQAASSQTETLPLQANDINESSSSTDSGEVQQFHGRKATNFQPISESQRRAQEWASERTSPILVSPLLVPKKITGKPKSQTISHQRAKEWADEAPSTRDTAKNATMNRMQETSFSRQENFSAPRVRYEDTWQEAPPPPPPLEEEENNFRSKSFSSLDTERSRPQAPVPVHVLPPQENIVLRKTDSPVHDGKIDYEKFKSSAPKVPLRKVEMPPRPTRSGSNNNFLASVKLRKTNSPTDRVVDNVDYNEGNSEGTWSYQEEEEYENPSDEWKSYDQSTQSTIRPTAAQRQEQQGGYIHKEQKCNEWTQENPPKLSYREQRERQLRAEQALKERVSESRSNEIVTPKLSYREQRERQLREEEAKRAAQMEPEEKEPDVQELIRRRIAANKENLIKNKPAGATSDKNDDLDLSTVRNKLRPVSPREPEVPLPQPTQDSSSIKNVAAKLRRTPRNHEQECFEDRFDNYSEEDDYQTENDNQLEMVEEIDQGKKTALMDVENESHAYDLNRTQFHEAREDLVEKDDQTENNQKDPHGNLSALFAQRSAVVNKGISSNNQRKEEKEDVSSTSEEDPEPSINNVSALFAKRAAAATKKPAVHDEIESTEEKEPSINNVAALFQQRSAMMNNTPPTKVKQKQKEDDLNDSSDSLMGNNNSNLLNLFAKRSSGAKKVEQKVESENDAMITVGDNAISKEPSANTLGGNPALKDNPAFAKYFKMLKMGLPMEVVKHAMTRDGVDASLMDGDHNKPVDDDSGVPLKEDPKYAKYFKMLKMGLPMGAVKNAMERDGENPSVMDGDHNLPASSGTKQKGSKTSEPFPKDKYRRTRLHWDTLRQVRSTSVWALVNQDPDVEQIEIDENEFAELFQAERGSTILSTDADQGKKRNAVKVIDPKRANNGGIILARLKITYEEMAVAIDAIDETVMSPEQMQGIVEYIPNKEEKIGLRKYMTSSDKESADAFDELCECEKFMVAMMTVKHSKEKVRAILFKQQFKQCMEELGQDVDLVEKSCDELRNSVRLRKLLGIVLNIGNRLNTAGPTRKGKAGAFTIESLLKLSQAKAFDKKTTFLHYIVMVVKRNNDSLIKFKGDIPSVLRADKIYWDQVENDLEEVENQLENVRKIALHEVYGKKHPLAGKKKGKDDDDMSQESMTLEAEVEALRSTKIGLFTLDAIKRVSSLRENVERTKKKFSKLLEYFGEEDKKKMSPHGLFEIIGSFSKDFDGAVEEVMKLEKQKKKAEEKKRGLRTNSPSSRSKDSSSNRDDESSTISGRTPPKPTNSRTRTSQSPSRRLKASSLQPHFSSSKPSKQKQKVSNTRQEDEGISRSQKKRSHKVESPMIDTQQMVPPMELQPHSSDDSVSKAPSDFSDGKNRTNKTMSTSSTSDSESQPQHRVFVNRVDSKEGGDENTAPDNSKNHNYPPIHSSESQSVDDIHEESIHSSSQTKSVQPLKAMNNARSRQEVTEEDVPVPTSVNTHSKVASEGYSPQRKMSDRQAMRQRARALRNQRISKRSPQKSPSEAPVRSIDSPGQNLNTHRTNGEQQRATSRQSHTHSPSPDHRHVRVHSPSPEQRRFRTHSPSPEQRYDENQYHTEYYRQQHQQAVPRLPHGQNPPSHNDHHHHQQQQQQQQNNKEFRHSTSHNNAQQSAPRRKPPSPEDVLSESFRSQSSSLSMSQERIRSRRERIERRRRIET